MISYLLLCISLSLSTEKNTLSFIETSALDSTNVETAFQNILTGTNIYTLCVLFYALLCNCSQYGLRLCFNLARTLWIYVEKLLMAADV